MSEALLQGLNAGGEMSGALKAGFYDILALNSLQGRYNNKDVSIEAFIVPINVHTIDGRQHIANLAINKRELNNKNV